MSKFKVGFSKKNAKAVKDALSSMKNETLLAISSEFQGADSITGGEWVKIKHKTKFSKRGNQQ